MHWLVSFDLNWNWKLYFWRWWFTTDHTPTLCHRQFLCNACVTYYEGRSKSSWTDTVNYEMRISYFVTFQHSHMQLKCTWFSVSPKLWFRYGRIVVLGLPASHLPCNTNTNGEYSGWRSSSKPEFWMAASAWADLWSYALSWLKVTYVFFPKLNEFIIKHKIFWRRGRYLHCKWMAGRQRTTILLQRNQSFWEMLDQAHFSSRCLCWKVTKYDVRIS